VKHGSRLKSNGESLDTTALPSLPRNWCWAQVNDVGEVKLGRQRSPEHHQGDHMRPYLRVANVYENRLELSDVLKMNFTPAEFETYRLRHGDILLNEGQSLEWVGRAAMYRDELPGSCFQNTLVRFRSRECVEPRFALWLFLYYLRNHRFQRIAKWTVNIAHLGAARFAEIEFPLAPLNEQRRIVEKIEELFSDLDAGVAALERAKANLKRYRAAVLKAAVEGKLATSLKRECYEPIRWQPLSDVVLSLEQGWSPKCEREACNDPNKWVVMKTTAIQPLRYLEAENKLLPVSLTPRPELEIADGDLLITRAGPRNRAAVACLVRRTRPRVILCDKAYRFRLDSSLADPGFIEIALNSPPIVDMLDELKTGISDSGVNLTQKRFLELRLPLPPLTEQRQIVAEVAEKLSQIEAADVAIDHSHARAARLRQSILKRAFAGQLVPQDPHDEPASTLLQRIKKSNCDAPSVSDPSDSVRPRRQRIRNPQGAST